MAIARYGPLTSRTFCTLCCLLLQSCLLLSNKKSYWSRYLLLAPVGFYFGNPRPIKQYGEERKTVGCIGGLKRRRIGRSVGSRLCASSLSSLKLFMQFSTEVNPREYVLATYMRAARPIISQLWSFIIRRRTFLNFIKLENLLILMLKNCEMAGRVPSTLWQALSRPAD